MHDFSFSLQRSWEVHSSGQLCKAVENCALLGNYAKKMRTVLFWAIMQWPLKMGLIDCPKTSVRNYHYSLCNSPEEHSSPQTIILECEMLKTSLPGCQTITMVVTNSRFICSNMDSLYAQCFVQNVSSFWNVNTIFSYIKTDQKTLYWDILMLY